MRKARMAPIGTNTFAVRVDSYVDGEMKGVFDGPGVSGSTKFTSLPGLILMIEEILDVEDDGFIASERPSTVSFEPNIELEVLFRQNYDWQGRVRWIDEGKEATFRSVLELMEILQTIFAEG